MVILLLPLEFKYPLVVCSTMSKQSRFSKLINDANNISKDILGFRVSFYDEALFKKFVNRDVGSLCQTFDEICITGYFSDGIAKIITKSLKGLSTRVRIITQEHNLSRKNDKRNLASLRKIQDAGVKIRVNHRTHFRMFLCKSKTKGLLVLGSFDFNKEGMNEERRDAGIYTTHPDLVESAFEYFNNVWNDEHDSKPLDEAYPDPKEKKKEKTELMKDEPSITIPNDLEIMIDETQSKLFQAVKGHEKDEYIISGSGIPAGYDVEIYFEKADSAHYLATFKSKADGTWSGAIKIPYDTKTGIHLLWMKEKSTDLERSVQIDVK